MKKFISRLLVTVTATMFVLTGCGKDEQIEYINKGIKEIEATNYATALEHLNAASEISSEGMALYRAYGLAYMGMSEYEKAVEAFEHALTYSSGELTDYEYDINYYLATAYYKCGMYKEAEAVYSAILALKPEERDAYYLRGVVELTNGEHDAAVEDFEKAISLDRNDYSIYINIYTTLAEYGYEEEGIQYLNSVMASENSGMSNFDKGRVCYYLGDYANACIYLEAAYKGSVNEEVILFLGRSYEAEGNLNYAITLYTKFLMEKSQSAMVYNQLGLCKLEQGNYKEALEAFQTAMMIENNNMMQTLKYNEIVAYEYLGEYTKALILMESYLTSYPDDVNAQREYEFLKTRA